MTNIVLLGAGSTSFSIELLKDISTLPSLGGSTLSLVDIDEKRLRMAEALVTRYCRESKMNLKIRAFKERRDALVGAEYVICAVKIGGYGPLEKRGRLQRHMVTTEASEIGYLAITEESVHTIRLISWKAWRVICRNYVQMPGWCRLPTPYLRERIILLDIIT